MAYPIGLVGKYSRGDWANPADGHQQARSPMKRGVQSENCARTTGQSSKFLCAVEREKRAREKNPDRAVGSLGPLAYLTKRRCAR